MKKSILALALAGSLTGCFTLYQSEFPEVATAAPGKDVSVQLAGFEATVTSYTPIYTYVPTYGGGWGGRLRQHRRHHLHGEKDHERRPAPHRADRHRVQLPRNLDDRRPPERLKYALRLHGGYYTTYAVVTSFES